MYLVPWDHEASFKNKLHNTWLILDLGNLEIFSASEWVSPCFIIKWMTTSEKSQICTNWSNAFNAKNTHCLSHTIYYNTSLGICFLTNLISICNNTSLTLMESPKSFVFLLYLLENISIRACQLDWNILQTLFVKSWSKCSKSWIFWSV